jgi:hypothetical protein
MYWRYSSSISETEPLLALQVVYELVPVWVFLALVGLLIGGGVFRRPLQGKIDESRRVSRKNISDDFLAQLETEENEKASRVKRKVSYTRQGATRQGTAGRLVQAVLGRVCASCRNQGRVSPPADGSPSPCDLIGQGSKDAKGKKEKGGAKSGPGSRKGDELVEGRGVKAEEDDEDSHELLIRMAEQMKKGKKVR